MTILVAGFGPFGSVARNPSELIAGELDGGNEVGDAVVGRVLPVSAERTPLVRPRRRSPRPIPPSPPALGVAPGRPR